MSSSSNDISEGNRAQKVTISSISPEILAVRIRKVSTEIQEEDRPKPSSTFRPIRRSSDVHEAGRLQVPKANRRASGSSQTVRKRSKSSGSVNNNSNLDCHSNSTMTDRKEKTTDSSEITRIKESELESGMDNRAESPPCLKHAAQNISRKADRLPVEKIKLCNGCSKSMLSYIFLVQDFLDSLAKEIVGEGTSHCLQCARKEARDSVASLEDVPSPKLATSSENVLKSHSEQEQSRINTKGNDSSSKMSSKRTQRTRSYRQESKRNEVTYGDASSPEIHPNSQQLQFVYNVSPPNKTQLVKDVNLDIILPPNADRHIHEEKRSGDETSVHEQGVTSTRNLQQDISPNHPNTAKQADDYFQNIEQNPTVTCDQNINSQQTVTDHYGQKEASNPVSSHSSVLPPNDSTGKLFHQQNEEYSIKSIFRAPMERVQPNYDKPIKPENGNQNDPNNNFQSQHSPSLFGENVDGIVSTLSNAEREIYDTARNRAGWESLTEPHERLGSSSSNLISSEAFVTSCRNNVEAIGCLVVGTSLLLSRTSRTLCVLVSDGVSIAFRGALSAVFQVVQNVRSLDSLGSTKLALLEQPELGISFEKLNVWRLTQFRKCVYLNPDTLVIQNCDELFCHEEMSAVPDIGWPDCFNSGVFVFAPSVHTFWQLMEFAEKQGSYDGGDQGLLNAYFSSWSSDISNKLSFIYNLMANVSYTYTPAFRQFGRNVKIVQFHGSFKPWHVKFFTKTGQVSPSSPVHPTYVQFVHIWLNIFRISVLRLMSQEIQSYSSSQETISAVEILRFFPLPTESEADFFLTPPSVRVRLAEKKLSRPSSLPISEVRRRKSAEYSRYVDPNDESITDQESQSVPEVSSSQTEEIPKAASDVADTSKSELDEPEKSKDKAEESTPETDEVFKEKEVTEKKKVKDKNSLPGAEVGDYQGMQAWEQGRIDYEGTDSSDNVIKRLQFIMSRPK